MGGDQAVGDAAADDDAKGLEERQEGEEIALILPKLQYQFHRSTS